MTKFHYTAVRDNGEAYEGVAEAPDRFAVYDIVRKERGTIVSISEKAGGFSFKKGGSIRGIFGSVRTGEKIIFAKNLSVMVKAGLPVSRALTVLERQTKNSKFKAILSGLGSDIKKGTSLNSAMKKHPKVFSSLFVSMVKAGEESGGLADSLNVVGKQMERAHMLTKKIRGAMIYPAIIVFAMIVIGIVMLIYVVPTLTQTFGELGVELPRSTQLVIATSNFLTDNTVIAIILLIIFTTLASVGFRTKTGRRAFDFFILRVPIISGLVRETNAARTARTLSSLLSAGVDVITSLSITGEVVQNSYYKAILKRAKEDIQKGRTISKAFTESEKYYPPLVGEMLLVGEETGNLSSMLLQTAVFYEGEIEQKTKDMSTIIEPFLMILIGAVVGFFAVSMISPIYSISSGI
jgi:type IV pilus assembly protein PilC